MVDKSEIQDPPGYNSSYLRLQHEWVPGTLNLQVQCRIICRSLCTPINLLATPFLPEGRNEPLGMMVAFPCVQFPRKQFLPSIKNYAPKLGERGQNKLKAVQREFEETQAAPIRLARLTLNLAASTPSSKWQILGT